MMPQKASSVFTPGVELSVSGYACGHGLLCFDVDEGEVLDELGERHVVFGAESQFSVATESP